MKLNAEQEKVLVALHDGYSTPEKVSKHAGLSKAKVQTILVQLKELGMIEAPSGLLEAATKTLKEMDDKLAPTDSGYAEHIILVASALTDANEEFLANELGYDKEFVSTVGSRLRNAGIWINGKLDAECRKSWMENSVAFWVDGGVACGYMTVVGGSGRDRKYKLTDAGVRRGASLMKKTEE